MPEPVEGGGGKLEIPVAGKTPVSLLQEICALDGLIPTYSLVQTEGQVHEPLFKYKVDVKSVSTSGSGHSKKRAKHGAAKSMLVKLQGLVMKGREKQFGVLREIDLSEDGEICTLLGEASVANYVGDLLQMCASQRLKPPIYESFVRPEGDRRFVMTCSVDTHATSGDGSSKKSAKREASRLMLDKLREKIIDVDLDSEGDNITLTEEEIAMLGQPRLVSRKKEMERVDDENYLNWYPTNSYKAIESALCGRTIKVESRPIVIHDCDDEPGSDAEAEEANNFSSSVRDATFEDEIRLLIESKLTEMNDEIADDSSRRPTVINSDAIASILLDERGKDGQFMAIVQMPISVVTSIPSLMGFGQGPTAEDAQLIAANDLISNVRDLIGTKRL